MEVNKKRYATIIVLWALEKNTRAIRFYQRYGFQLTGERRLEDGTSEYLVRMQRGNSTWRTTRQ